MSFLIGASVEVVSSANPLEIGLKGVVVRDLKNTLVILTEDNETKVVLKKNRFFRFETNGKVFIMNGNAFLGRFHSRMHKKNRKIRTGTKNGKKYRS